MDLREQNFGIEIEMTGITRSRAADVLAEYFNSRERYGGSYGAYGVRDNEGREWKIVYDGSLNCQKKSGTRKISAGREYSVELVSPICKYDDIEKVQEMVRKLREAGAFSNTSCGIHYLK